MASELGSVNFKSIMTEAQTKINELIGLIGTESSGGVKGSGTKYEDVSVWLKKGNQAATSVQQLVEGDDPQKASAIQRLVSDLSDLLSNIGCKEAGKATKKAKNNEEKIEKNRQVAEKTSQDVAAMLEGIMNDCTASADAIKVALEKIGELGGDQGKIKAAENELKAQLEIIEANKKILNDPSADNGKKLSALAAILMASQTISNLVASVEEYKTLIEGQNKVVKTNSESLAANSVRATEQVQEGATKIKESLIQAGVLTEEQAALALEGGGKTAVGKAQNAIGQTMQKTPVTAAEGVKQTLAGQDKMSAGSQLMKASTEGMSKLTASIGEMGSYLTNFAQFANGIGQFVEGTTELVGQYDSFVNPLIESIGSWKSAGEAITELESYTQEYSQEVLGEQATTLKDKQTNSFTAESIQGANASQANFTEFKFDTSTIKRSFGI